MLVTSDHMAALIFSDMTLFIITIISCLILLIFVFYTVKNGISPYPSTRKITKTISQELKHLKPKSLIDLGSGWGHLIFPIATELPNTMVIGIENFPLCFLFCWLRQKIIRHKNLTLVFKNFYNYSLAKHDVILCFLYPGAMVRLKEKFSSELKPGTIVISHTFAIHRWTPIKTINVDDFPKTKIYIYEIR